jgi:hypothetical protein
LGTEIFFCRELERAEWDALTAGAIQETGWKNICTENGAIPYYSRVPRAESVSN